jgi:hypothetical protein
MSERHTRQSSKYLGAACIVLQSVVVLYPVIVYNRDIEISTSRRACRACSPLKRVPMRRGMGQRPSGIVNRSVQLDKN